MGRVLESRLEHKPLRTLEDAGLNPCTDPASHLNYKLSATERVQARSRGCGLSGRRRPMGQVSSGLCSWSTSLRVNPASAL